MIRKLFVAAALSVCATAAGAATVPGETVSMAVNPADAAGIVGAAPGARVVAIVQSGTIGAATVTGAVTVRLQGGAVANTGADVDDLIDTGGNGASDNARPFLTAITTSSHGTAVAAGNPGRARSFVPEPASWALMIAGFGVVGYAMRRAVRRSNARFDERIRRITAGEID